jgi:hypothetical protein
VLQADKDHLPGAFNAGVDAAEARLRARVAAQEQQHQHQQERRDPAPGRRQQQTAVASQRAITNFLATLKKKRKKIRYTFLLLQIYMQRNSRHFYLINL